MRGADPVVLAGLVKSFGRREVLTGVDLRVPRGSTTAILGRNGAGKSTLFRILCGILPRSGGEVRTLGLDPAHSAREIKARIGYVAEATPFHPRWRVRDAIGLVRSLRDDDWDGMEESRLREAFALPLRARIGTLSKGERAKLALLLALGHRPELVLLDEPASGLDPVMRREVLATLVDAIHEQGRTLLIASHRMDDVERLADRVAFLSGGRIVLSGEAEEVRARSENLEELFVDLLSREVTRCAV
jgi:ABC-2 type transport system ATP-binding protein